MIEPALSWLHEVRRKDRGTAQQIGAAIRVLAEEGPALGRPLVDTVRGSRLPHLKELRPGSTGGSEVRLLFALDPERRAVFLVGGDKSGRWSQWYDNAIKEAEAAYEEFLAATRQRPAEEH